MNDLTGCLIVKWLFLNWKKRLETHELIVFTKFHSFLQQSLVHHFSPLRNNHFTMIHPVLVPSFFLRYSSQKKHSMMSNPLEVLNEDHLELLL